MFGWTGTILRINLSANTIKKEHLEEKLRKDYIGAHGINARLLYDEVGRNVDPLAPENKLMLGVGPLVGTIAPSCSRVSFTAKSPLTGTIGYSSVGGHFGPEVKFAGYDHIIVEGKAEKPVYIWINDKEIKIEDARHLRDKTTWETDDVLKKHYKDREIKTACIGPAAENGVLISSIVCGRYHAAGKGGLGSVMASKNLKAIAVRGSNGVRISDTEEFAEVADQVISAAQNHPTYPSFSNYGTLMMVDIYNRQGIQGTRNRSTLAYETTGHSIDSLTAETFVKNYKDGSVACFGCPIHCTHWHSVRKGAFAGSVGEKPELQWAGLFGANCDLPDLAAICYIGNFENQYGLDNNDAGNIMAMAMDLYNRGIISKETTGGIDLSWGNAQGVIEMLRKIVKREGFGEILGRGFKGAAEELGFEGGDITPGHVKGLSWTGGKDCRGCKAWALAHAVAPRGSDHLTALPVFEQMGTAEESKKRYGSEKIVDPLSDDPAKGRMVKKNEDFIAVINSCGLCVFLPMFLPGSLEMSGIARMLSSGTGYEFNEKELWKTGERIYNVLKAYNTRLGFTRKDDQIPKHNYVPAPDGPAKGETVVYEPMLNEYYKARGWEVKRGLPTRAKLEELGLKDIADDLELNKTIGIS